MDRQLARWHRETLAVLFTCLISCAGGYRVSGAGVTLITHGYNGNVTGWVTGMANGVPDFDSFPGTNFTGYTMVVSYSGGSYYLSTTRTSGAAPFQTDSGEIIIKLDWSQLAGGVFSTYSTYDIAGAVAWGLLQTNLISELQGHSLMELPVHLIGHSRGGSLVSEISRVLGTNGVWVDQLTTLDPHPLNNDGFSDLPSGVDAPVRTYANVLFHDNYWQDLGDGYFDPIGEPVAGAYIRQLVNLSGGYNNTGSVSPYHSNVHLWYFGTIDLATPASDTEASLGAAARASWWVATEGEGRQAGFRYSLMGGADRLSAFQPLGPGFSAIRDGYNQFWDLGAGVSGNRTALASNNGAWPSLIRLNRTETNDVVQGQTTSVSFYYQWARPASSQATISFYLDDELNPFKGKGRFLTQFSVAGTGASNVAHGTVSLALNATNAPPGRHAIYAKISAGGRTRYLYAPEWITVLPAPPPIVDISSLPAGEVAIGVTAIPGDRLVLQASTDLATWEPLATNTLSGTRWNYVCPADRFIWYFRAKRF